MTATNTPPAIPEGVPAKFIKDGQVDVAGLAKSYTELESRHSQPPQPQGNLSIAPPTIDDNAGPAEILKAAGLDVESVTKTFAEKGQLTPEQYAALGRVGYPKAVVNQYLKAEAMSAAAMKSAMQSATQQAIAKAGGEQQHATLVDFARANLLKKDAIFDAINARVEQDPTQYPVLIEYVSQKHREAVGAGRAAPLAAGGAGAPAGSGQPFATEAEKAAAVGDPRYAEKLANGARNPKYDPAYRQQIMARLMATARAKGRI